MKLLSQETPFLIRRCSSSLSVSPYFQNAMVLSKAPESEFSGLTLCHLGFAWSIIIANLWLSYRRPTPTFSTYNHAWQSPNKVPRNKKLKAVDHVSINFVVSEELFLMLVIFFLL